MEKDIDDMEMRDGLGTIATLLGGIALSASQSKKQLETSKSREAVNTALKGVGLTLAGIIGAGGAIADFIHKTAKK